MRFATYSLLLFLYMCACKEFVFVVEWSSKVSFSLRLGVLSPGKVPLSFRGDGSVRMSARALSSWWSCGCRSLEVVVLICRLWHGLLYPWRLLSTCMSFSCSWSNVVLVVLSFVSIAPFDLVSFSSEFNHRAQGRSAQVLLVEARRRMVDSIGSVGEACVVETCCREGHPSAIEDYLVFLVDRLSFFCRY